MACLHGIAAWRREAPPADPAEGNGAFACAVAIPARDEADLIDRCLTALSVQDGAPDFAVVLFLNNCRDDTAARVKQVAPSLQFPLYVSEAHLPQGFADAAWARRLSMNAACALVREDGTVLSTDADSFAAPTWIKDCLASIEGGADLVCGFVAPDFSDAPALDFDRLRQAAREYEYSQLAAELGALIDPDGFDPWPRHQMETGANLAIKASVLRALGGVPHVCPGEDQALVRLARFNGFHVRHDFTPHVTTSSRINGRATGGWGDDLRARVAGQNLNCHEKLEPARVVVRRALLRARLHRDFGTDAFVTRVQRLVDSGPSETILSARTFEEAWSKLEAACALLAPQPLLTAALDANLDILRRAVEARRATDGSMKTPLYAE